MASVDPGSLPGPEAVELDLSLDNRPPFGPQTIASEASCDEYFRGRYDTKGKKPELQNVERALQCYQDCLAVDPANDRIMAKYIKAVDYKYSYVVRDEAEGRKTYRALIDMLEAQYQHNKQSAPLNYCLALIWGRYGEHVDKIKAATSGVAGKIKSYAESLYKIDNTYEGCSAGQILGRLHYMAPRIPLILTWPDIRKSRAYLIQVVEKCPDSLRGSYYLADTLYELGEKESARGYYEKVRDAKPSEQNYAEDAAVIRECIERMKSTKFK